MALSKIVRDSLNTGIDDNSDATAITIDSSERVGIGTSAPSGAKLDIFTGSTAADGLKINRFGSGVYYSTLRQDTHGLAVHVGDGSNISERAAITPNGLTFNGDTAAANALDDYEIGTWSPSFTNGHTGAYTITNARYTKMGQQVYAGTYLSSLNIPNDSNPFYVAGLPFTVAGSQMYHAASSITFVHSFNIATKHVLPPTPSTGGNLVYFHRGDGTNAVMTNSDFHGITNLIFGISYISDA